MATTTNYSWVTPDDTALVKDGAAAIRTLGSSVDTTTKALNPSTTLGDIEYRSSTANTNTRLPIGSTGNILTVAGGVPTWAAPAAAGGMTLINTGGTTLTGASVTISSIPSTYKNLQLIVRNYKPADDNVNLQIRFNGDSGNKYGTSDSGSNLSFGTSFFYGSSQQTSSTSNALQAIDIFDYTSDTWKIAFVLGITNVSSTNFNTFRTLGVSSITAAISSITLFPSSGNFTSGTAYLYGVS